MIASVDPPSLCVPPSGTLRRAAPLRHTARDRHAALHGGRRAHGREDASEGSEVQKGLALSPISVFGTDSFMELGSIISPGGSKTLVRSRRRAHALHRLPRTGCPSLEGQDLPDPAWIRLIRSGPSKGGARSILELFVSARTRGGVSIVCRGTYVVDAGDDMMMIAVVGARWPPCEPARPARGV